MKNRLNAFTSELEKDLPEIIFVSIFSFDAQSKEYLPFFTQSFIELAKEPLEELALDAVILLSKMESVPCSQITTLDKDHFELILMYEEVVFFYVSEKGATSNFIFQNKCKEISENILPYINVIPTKEVKKNIPTFIILRDQYGVNVKKHTHNQQEFIVHTIQKDSLGPFAQSSLIQKRKNLMAPLFETGVFAEPHYKFTDTDLQVARKYIEGTSMAKRVETKKEFTRQQSLDIICSLLAALEPLHAKGLSHGNLNPYNIYFTVDNRIRLVDDYLFELISTENFIRKSYSTEKRIPVGHLGFLSPEQLLGVSPTLQSDFWSLGYILCYLLLGKSLMSFVTPSQQIVASHYTIKQAVMEQICHRDKTLEPLLNELLEGNPDKRFRSHKEFLAVLNAYV